MMVRTCDDWRFTRRCCRCGQPLTKQEWRKAGKPGQGYTNLATGLRIWHPTHLRCGQGLAQDICDLAEALGRIAETSRWN